MKEQKKEKVEEEKIESEKEEISIPQMISEIHDIIKPKIENGKKKKKVKEFKIPAKGKVSKTKAAKGYVIVQKIEENRNISFEKQKIDMEVFRTNDGVHHASDGKEIFFYKGKPLLIQPSWKQNPFNPLDTKNEVYGQKPILARMQTAAYTGEIKKKAGMGGIIWIIVIAVAGYLIYNLITKGRIA